MLQRNDDFAEALERAQAGDEVALGRLLDKYRPTFESMARNLIGRRLQSFLDEGDLVQSIQIILLTGFRTGKFQVTTERQLLALVRTLLERKAARHCRDHKPTMAGTAEFSLSDTLADQPLDDSAAADPGCQIEFDEGADHLLRGLDDVDRQLVQLRLDGYTTAEAARKLGLDSGFLRVRLSRLRKRLSP